MIKNQELAEQIMLLIDSVINATISLAYLLDANMSEDFQNKGKDLYSTIKGLEELSYSLKEEESGLNLPQATESIKVSLERILLLGRTEIKKALHKIEFELIPLIEEMRINFYFWGMVYPNEERIKNYYMNDVNVLGGNIYTRQAIKEGKYKYDLSIFVLAYNKKEYTEKCLEYLYKYLPSEISYEIILVNHGSNDGTKELFEKYHPDKQLDIAVNGGGSNAVFRIAEGKYIMMISNDILVTKNAIQNMYNCINSDEKIAWVVATTPNISNLQAIPAKYENYEDMERFAETNNISNPFRWEQRARLCNPIDMVRAEFLEQTKAQYIFHSKNRMSFPDDRKSLICRRSGYKMYLVKDAYCYHFGSVTLKEDETINSATHYQKGRAEFLKFFKIDPWVSGYCFSPELMEVLECQNINEVKILGIECGMGSNPLKVKETIKENVHNTNCYIRNCVLDNAYMEDLKGVSDEVQILTSINDLDAFNEKYDYIISEMCINDLVDFYEVHTRYHSLIEKEGIVIMLINTDIAENAVENIKHNYKNVKVVPAVTGYNGYAWLVFCK